MTEPQPQQPDPGPPPQYDPPQYDRSHYAAPQPPGPYETTAVAPYQGQQPVPYPQTHAPAYQPQMVSPKSPILHGLASFFLAGLGTMLAGRPGRGLLIMGAAFINWVLFFIPIIGLLFIISGFGITVFSVIHGYLSAVKWNARHGVIS